MTTLVNPEPSHVKFNITTLAEGVHVCRRLVDPMRPEFDFVCTVREADEGRTLELYGALACAPGMAPTHDQWLAAADRYFPKATHVKFKHKRPDGPDVIRSLGDPS